MGVYVIHADLESFDVPVGSLGRLFAIPLGTFTSGQWDEVSAIVGAGGSSPNLTLATQPSNTSVQTATYPDLTPVAATAGQMTDINAAAGGNLSAIFTWACTGGNARRFTSLTLTLTGTLCTYAISPSSAAYAAAGGAGSILVTASAGSCPWTATCPAAWVTITTPSGTGTASCAYSVAANTGPARTAIITIAGYAFTVSQASGQCTYSLSSLGASFDALIHNAQTFNVITQGTCPWTATCADAWITLTSASGAGGGAVVFNVAANAGVGRNSTIFVQGIAYTVTQQGVSCSFNISPVSQLFPALGGLGLLNIITQTGCAWTAVSNNGWLVITSGASGAGQGTTGFTVAPNTGSANARVGTITAGGLTFTVSQLAGEGSGFAVLAPADFGCVNGTTRPIMRDRIRRAVGVTPPADTQPLGVVGEAPLGQPTPTNAELNQAISDAISWINDKLGFVGSTAVKLTVPAYSGTGVQFIPLTGAGPGSGTLQNNINTVQKAVWNQGDGSALFQLRATDAAEKDQSGTSWDNTPASVPRVYMVERYQFGLLPGAQTAGTVQLFAGTSVYTFCGDADVLNILPKDYELVLENVATLFISQRRPSEPAASSRIQFLGGQDGTGENSGLVAAGINMLGTWYNDTTPQQTKSLGMFGMRRSYGTRRIRR